MLETISPRSHEAVGQWYGKAEALFQAEKKRRRAIALDETKIKVRNRWIFVWAANDVDSWEVLATRGNEGESGFEASASRKGFLNYVMEVQWDMWIGHHGIGML